MTIQPKEPSIISPLRIKATAPSTGPVVAPKPPLTYVQRGGAKVWTGEGPPPPLGSSGIAVGDTYVDSLTGIIWRLDPGE